MLWAFLKTENIYDEFVHSFKIIAHKRLIRTYSVFIIFHSITFPKQYVLFEFNTSDYFFIKNTTTLRAFHNSRSHMSLYTHMMCFAKKFYDIQSHGFMKDNINFELRVRRTYGLLPLLS